MGIQIYVRIYRHTQIHKQKAQDFIDKRDLQSPVFLTKLKILE